MPFPLKCSLDHIPITLEILLDYFYIKFYEIFEG